MTEEPHNGSSGSGSSSGTGDTSPPPTGVGGALEAEPTSGPDDVPCSPAGGTVRCFVVPDPGADLDEVAIPGFPAPIPVPVPILVPVVADTGDSTSTRVDQDVVIYVDIDNGQVVDGAPRGGRVAQRVPATIAVLLIVPVLVASLIMLVRRLGNGAARRPPPLSPRPFREERHGWPPAGSKSPVWRCSAGSLRSA